MPFSRNNWHHMPWQMLDTFLSGKSGIDVPRLHVHTLPDAEQFLGCYGFDWSLSEHRRELESIRLEAIGFIEEELLFDEPALAFPKEVRGEKDVRKLLLWASSSRRSEHQRWTCALLRVMHTFAHCGTYFQEMYGDEINRQILNRFEEHVHEVEGKLFLGAGENAIPLHHFTMRGEKSRTSQALKMLHKAENVAADIFDWMGLRFVTESRFDAMLVTRYLHTHRLVMFANVKPGRSRNTLLDITELKEIIAAADHVAAEENTGPAEQIDVLRERTQRSNYPGGPSPSYNPFSSSTYHSIQFTAAHLVRIQNPQMMMIQRLVSSPSASKRIAGMLERFGVSTEISFFFPYEVQILDRESYERSRSGRASHSTYKERQRQAVKERIWGDLLLEERTPIRVSPERTASYPSVE